MAIRQVRVFFHMENATQERITTQALWQPFTEYFDRVMRGNFKKFSGVEVERVNIVNLMLHQNLNNIKVGYPLSQWDRVMNSFEYNVIFDFSLLTKNRSDNLRLLVETFIECAKESSIPQIQNLSVNARSALDTLYK